MLNRLIAISIFVLACIGGAIAQETQTDPSSDRVLVIYDSSNSMWGELSDATRKYEAGRAALASVLDTGLDGREIGFRAYGHRRAGDCRDSELIVPFSADAAARTSVSEAVTSIRPTGKTPINYSLREGLKDFDGQPGDILLISDGIETCDADPCDLMREWSASNVDIRVHVVGVGLNTLEREAMVCIAEESGGQYFDADSTEGFEEALNDVSEVIETVEAAPSETEGTSDTSTPTHSYAFRVIPIDASGHQYSHIRGTLFKNGEAVHDGIAAQGRGRNVVEGPGDYEIEVGVLLRDGSAYKPVRVPFSVTDGPDDTIVEVLVAAPARVKASFTESGEAHRGAHVTAYQDGEVAFSFRAIDEVNAAPGTYEFRSAPNDDNPLALTATLEAGNVTTLEYELIETVKIKINFELPDGKIIRRHSQLWADGEKVYDVLSGNGATVRPGTYELHADDQNAPLTPTEITIDATEGKTYTIPLDVGWIKILFAEPAYDYIRGDLPNRALLYSLDRDGSKFSRPNTLIPVAPGRYAVEGNASDGFFDRLEIEVASGETVDVTITPEPLGELVMTYAPSENYLRDPDRGSVAPLDGQRVVGGILRPGTVRKLYPGRYRVSGYSYAGDIVEQEIDVAAGERTEVVLRLRGE